MAFSLVMPELGESITEGTIVRWLKSVGDNIEVDEPVLEISTDKVDTEIPSPIAGVLGEIKAQEDDVIEVGGILGIINESGSNIISEETPTQETNPQKETELSDNISAKIDNTSNGISTNQSKIDITESKHSINEQNPKIFNSIYATPLVRKIASENSIDLNTITGSGIGGRIRKEDLLKIIDNKKSSKTANSQNSSLNTSNNITSPENLIITDLTKMPGVKTINLNLRGTIQKTNKIREITAKKTFESLQTTAQLTQTFEIDLTKLVKLRTKFKNPIMEKYGFNLTYLHIISFAVTRILELHPNINATISDNLKEITYYPDVNLSIAIDTEGGLLSPVIHKANEMSLVEIGLAISDLALRARNNKLKPNELFGGTFAITNIGSLGALFDTPILIPAQAGILGIGTIVKRPMIVKDSDGNENISVRSMMYFPLTYDHRLVDGADAGRFLSSLKYLLENPDFIFSNINDN